MGGFPLGSHVVSKWDTGPRSWAFQIHDLDTTSGYLSLHPSSRWENRGRRDGWVWVIEDSHADFKSGWGWGQILALLRAPTWAPPSDPPAITDTDTKLKIFVGFKHQSHNMTTSQAQKLGIRVSMAEKAKVKAEPPNVNRGVPPGESWSCSLLCPFYSLPAP